MYQWYQLQVVYTTGACVWCRESVMMHEKLLHDAVGMCIGGYRLVAAVHTGRREGCCSIRALNLEP